MAPANVLERLRQIDRDCANDATIVDADKRDLVRGGKICNLVKDLHNAGSKNNGRFFVPQPRFAPRNDLTIYTTPYDIERTIEPVSFAFANFAPLWGLSDIHRLETHELQTTVGAVDDIAQEATVIPPGQSIVATDCDIVSLQAKALAFGIPRLNVSRALMDDSPRFAAAVLGILMGRLARGVNRVFSAGAADGRPVGLLQTAPVGKTAASETAFTTDELWDLVSQVPAPYRKSANCCWMMHSAVEADCRRLKDGAARPLWKAAGLNQWPIVANDHMPSSVAAGQRVMLFGDFSQHKIVAFGDLRIDRLAEPRAEFNEDVFQGYGYFDGGLLDAGTKPIVALQMAA